MCTYGRGSGPFGKIWDRPYFHAISEVLREVFRSNWDGYLEYTENKVKEFVCMLTYPGRTCKIKKNIMHLKVESMKKGIAIARYDY